VRPPFLSGLTHHRRLVSRRGRPPPADALDEIAVADVERQDKARDVAERPGGVEHQAARGESLKNLLDEQAIGRGPTTEFHADLAVLAGAHRHSA